MTAERAIRKALIYWRDYNAIRRGKVGRRIGRRIYGHPYSRLVYASVIFRLDPTLRSGVEQQHCPHNHYKRAAADTCAERAARRLNRSTP